MQGLQDARVSLTGDITAVEGQEAEQLRGLYRKRHPDSFWVDFGDFSIFRMVPKTGRLIGGFARAGQVKHLDNLKNRIVMTRPPFPPLLNLCRPDFIEKCRISG